MFRRFTPLFIVLLLFINLLSIAATASSQLVYNSAANNDERSSTSNYVSVNSNNSIIAGAYSKEVILFDTTDYSVIDVLEFERDVYDIKFSPDGSKLAITTVGIAEFLDSVILYDISENQILQAKQRTNSVRSSISWTPDSNYLAVANFQNGINLINTDNMEIEEEYSNEHLTDISCIEFSNDGQLLISGDKDGTLNLWNYDGTFTGKSFNLQGEITGCGFNSQNQRISAVSIEGDISTWTITGNLLHEKSINSAMQMIWSDNLDVLYVLESGNEPRLIHLDGSTFNELSSTYFIHKALDFDITQMSNGVISDLYVATDTNHITNYAQPSLREGYGESGADFDGDKVPDSIDEDDDGDSFYDEWDFNCPVEIVDCARNPDIDHIRNINFRTIGDTLIIEDTYTFGLSSSAEIRNLTRRSIISDQQINYEEANLFENAICKNLDSNDIILSWRNNLELSVGQVVNGSLECIVSSGLAFSGTFDTEGVKFTMKLEFDIIPNATMPFDLTIKEQIIFSDSTITHLAENHPIFISQNGVNTVVEGQIWWINDGSLSITFSEEEEFEKSLKVYNFLSNKINLAVVVMIVSTLLFVIIRRRNKITIDLDDEDFDEIDEELNEPVSNDFLTEMPVSQPVKSVEIQLVDDEPMEQQFIQSEDTAINRKSFTLEDDQMKVPQVKRRAGRMDRNKQGPIMSTKRKRLGGNEQTPNKALNVRTVKKDIKTRKVRKVSKEINDDEISWELD